MGKISRALAYSKTSITILMAILVPVGFMQTACTEAEKNKLQLTIGLVTNNRNGLRNIEGFRDKMTELGYGVGKNVTYMYDESPVKGTRLIDTLKQMVDANVDLIFTAGTPTGVAAHRITAGTKIPVIFGVIADPIAAGVLKDLNRPGGNMTGVKLAANQARRMQFLLEMIPGPKRILIPFNPEDTASSSAVRQIKKVSSGFGVEIVQRWAHNEQEVDELFRSIPENLNAIFLVPGTTVNIHLQKVLAVANRHKLPVSGPSLAQVQEGALISYGFNHYEAGKQAARLADQVLRGVNPGDLPVETAEFFLAVNLKAAETIDLEVPYSILQQAEIIVRTDTN